MGRAFIIVISSNRRRVMNTLVMAMLIASWVNAFSTGININQSYYSQSWQSGDVGAISWTAFLNLGLKKSLSQKLLFTNNLSMAFGQTYTQDAESKKWKPPMKSSDKLENEAVLKLTMGWPIDPFASARVLTQFYDNEQKLYLNPATFTESFGAARDIYSPNDSNMVTARLGLSFKEVVNRADTGSVPIDGGLEFVASANFNLAKNVLYKSNLRVFKALYSFNPSGQTWKSPDVNFENTVQITVTKLIKLQIYAQWLYDRDQIDKVQFRENLALSIMYSL